MTVSEAFKVHSSDVPAAGVGRRPLLWLSALCLDAPLVALAWQLLFARAFGFRLHLGDLLALVLTAWWIYLTDRLADSLATAPAETLTARVAFCLHHRRAFSVGLVLVGLADAAVIVMLLDRSLIENGALLGGVALVDLFVNSRHDRLWQLLPIKELAVGFLFACGTTLVFLTASPRLALFLAVFLFGCVCSLNCLSIAVWEKNLDLGQGKHSYATEHPRWVGLVRIGCLVIAIVSCALGGRAISPLLAAPLATSSALLLLLHFVDVRDDGRTALADIALLIPALIFLVPGLW